jgi:hypothetical protein
MEREFGKTQAPVAEGSIVRTMNSLFVKRSALAAAMEAVKTPCAIIRWRLALPVLLLLAALLGAAPVHAQVCTNPIVAVLSQFDADNFACSEVTGLLFISDHGNGGITDLTGLSILTTVGGDLVIQDSAALVSLAGLENLSSVGGNVGIGDRLFGGNPALVSLTGLEGLASIGGDLIVLDNDALVSLTGLENLTFVGGNVKIGDDPFAIGDPRAGNPALVSLTGLSGLTVLDGSLTIKNNAALMSLTGLENLVSIGLQFTIDDNASLDSMLALESLAFVDGHLSITENPSLTSLAGLENLSSVGAANDGSLVIRANPGLASLTGLAALTTVAGGFEIRDTETLVSLAGLENLTSVDGLFLGLNDALVSLAGLDNLTDIRSLGVGGNQALTSLAGAESVASLGNLVVRANHALPSLAGLENLASLSSLTVEVNDTLASLEALENITSLNGNLIINVNPALVSLAGLENITSVGSVLQIFGNDGLVSLAGLDSLTSVGTGLLVSFNPALQSLAGLENLVFVRDLLGVFFNDALVDCACGVAGLISGSPAAFTGVAGQVDIFNNEPGGLCTSPSVVLAVPPSSCTTSNAPPDADAAADQMLECTGSQGTQITLDGSGSFDPDGDTLTYSWAIDGEEIAIGVSPTVSLESGMHTVVLTVDDGNGATATDEVEITVVDTTVPVLTVDAEPLILWPPNHEYHVVSLLDLGLTASDGCDGSLEPGSVVIASVASDEPENYLGDGNTTDDIVLDDCQTVHLRAERQGELDGRVYTLTLAIADASGNAGTATYHVQVPHSLNSTAVGGPEEYSVEGCAGVPN